MLVSASLTRGSGEAGIGGFYYVMNGEGSATVAAKPRPSKPAMLIPASAIGETKAFQNTGTAPLEFLVIGIASDMTKKHDILATPAPRRGGPGRAGGGLAR